MKKVKNQFPFKIYYIYDYEGINNKLGAVAIPQGKLQKR